MLMSTISESPLYEIARPRSIAFFGASNNFAAMGSSILNSILTDGYEGRIFPVHPKEKRVFDLEAYAHVRDLPEVPDHDRAVLESIASLAGLIITRSRAADALRARFGAEAIVKGRALK